MNKIILFCLLFLVFGSVDAQQRYADSLKNVLAAEKEFRGQVNTMGLLSTYYENLYPDSALYFSNKMIDLSALQAIDLLFVSAGYSEKVRMKESKK